jgi:toxin ParE1/3/4
VKLRYTLRGAAELDQILDYIETRSPQGARHVQARIQFIIDLLLQHPRAGRLTRVKLDCDEWSSRPIRFLIFYRATEDEIVIHGVRHTARRPSAPE